MMLTFAPLLLQPLNKLVKGVETALGHEYRLRRMACKDRLVKWMCRWILEVRGYPIPSWSNGWDRSPTRILDRQETGVRLTFPYETVVR